MQKTLLVFGLLLINAGIFAGQPVYKNDSVYLNPPKCTVTIIKKGVAKQFVASTCVEAMRLATKYMTKSNVLIPEAMTRPDDNPPASISEPEILIKNL